MSNDEYWHPDGNVDLGSSYITIYDCKYVFRPLRREVTFDSVGGNQIPTMRVWHDRTLGELPVTTRQGYTFQGWFDSNGTQFATSTRIT